MGVSYHKLRELLFKKKIQKKTLISDLGLSSKTIARINKDEYMDIETLERIADYLRVDISEIISSD